MQRLFAWSRRHPTVVDDLIEVAGYTHDDSIAIRDLRLVIGRISRRIRQLYAARSTEDDASFVELAVLSRLERDGALTPGGLAARERVTAQPIAPVLTALENGSRSLGPPIRRTADG